MTEFHDHQSLIGALDGAAAVAVGVGTLAVNVRAWAARNRIPAEYWPEIIVFAAGKGVSVSAEWLMRTLPARRKADPTAEAEAA